MKNQPLSQKLVNLVAVHRKNRPRSNSLSKKLKTMVNALRKSNSTTNQWWLPNSAFLFAEVRELLGGTTYLVLHSDCVAVIYCAASESLVFVIEVSPSTQDCQVIRLDHSTAHDVAYKLVCDSVDESAAYLAKKDQQAVTGEIRGLPPMSEIYSG